MKYLLIFLSLIVMGWVQQSPIEAIVDPVNYDNNRFGIHISDQADISAAAALVNSNGGDWGYVTLVIRENDRDLSKWQQTFDRLRQARLIPIVRLATQFDGNNWIKPREADIQPWITFLDSLNWITQNRYVIIFNEPNQAAEWGGEINPTEYAQFYRLFYQALKEADSDFFVLPAGLDTAAENSHQTMHPQTFWAQMHQADPAIFSLYDGWVSHSYPNPGFTGSVYDTTRMSIRNYLWELSTVEKYAYDSNKPIFITETGWAVRQGSQLKSNFLNIEQASENMTKAFQQMWTDKRIVAITPFILNYDHPPFEQFSWYDPITRQPTLMYSKVQELPKLAGRPSQIDTAQSRQQFFPKTLLANSKYKLAVSVQNTGQKIWDHEHQLRLVLPNSPNSADTVYPLTSIAPGETAKIWLQVETPATPQTIPVRVILESPDKTLLELDYRVQIVKPTNLISRLRIWIQDVIQTDFTATASST